MPERVLLGSLSAHKVVQKLPSERYQFGKIVFNIFGVFKPALIIGLFYLMEKKK